MATGKLVAVDDNQDVTASETDDSDEAQDDQINGDEIVKNNHGKDKEQENSDSEYVACILEGPGRSIKLGCRIRLCDSQSMFG